MEEISNIISAITEATGLDQSSIKFGRTDECKRARGILCYIALKDKYGLTQHLCKTLGKSKKQCVFAAQQYQEDMDGDVQAVMLMNKVRKHLGMSAIMTYRIDEEKEVKRKREREIESHRSNENARRLFGFETSPSIAKVMEQAMKESAEYMQTYCKMGKKVNPLLCN